MCCSSTAATCLIADWRFGWLVCCIGRWLPVRISQKNGVRVCWKKKSKQLLVVMMKLKKHTGRRRNAAENNAAAAGCRSETLTRLFWCNARRAKVKDCCVAAEHRVWKRAPPTSFCALVFFFFVAKAKETKKKFSTRWIQSNSIQKPDWRPLMLGLCPPFDLCLSRSASLLAEKSSSANKGGAWGGGG